MRIEYSLEREDLEAFYRNSAKTDPSVTRINRRIYGIAFTILTLLSFWTAEDISTFLISMVPLVLFFLVWMGIASFLQPRILRRSIRDLAQREVENRGVLGKHSLTLDEAGIEEETAVNKTFTKYEGVNRLDETGELLLVFISASAAHIIPKRTFPSEREKDEFWNFLTAKLKAARAT